MAEYKIDMQKSVAEKDMRKIIPFTIASKKLNT
jgi:hypothetical protein